MRYEYAIEIDAPVEMVWETMFGLEGYKKWTKIFFEGSYFEGSWAEGQRMHFLAPDGSGMVSEITKNKRHELMSIKHIGFVADGVEDTTSDKVKAAFPLFEDYHFEARGSTTEVKVVQEATPDDKPFMDDIWPKALGLVKSLCESE